MDIAKVNRWWYYTGEIRSLLYVVFFFFMPFTQALTFNVGFPLKFSELAILLLGSFYLLFDRKVPLPRSFAIALSAFFFIVTVSFIINLFWLYPYPLKSYESRFGYAGDSISRYFYFIIALLSLIVSVDIFLNDTTRFVKLWLYGAVLAAAYACYLTIFSFLRWPVYLLPGMKNPPQMISGYIIRCGTFAEGNYMGLFLFLSGVMSFYIRKFKTGIFLFASVFTSFATLSILSVFLFLILYLKRFIFRKKFVPYFILGGLLLIPALHFFTATKFYNEYIYKKIFGSPTHVSGEASLSKVDRILTGKVAYRTAIHNPVLGVGLSNFGRHYDRYYTRDNLSLRDYKTFQRKNYKIVPNNIYLEVWSECGTMALLLFLAILILLLYYSYFDKALFYGMICLLLCFIAYPSFIMIYLWAFLALPIANYCKKKI